MFSYKDAIPKQNNSIPVSQLLIKKDDDENDINTYFHQCFFDLFQMDQNKNYNGEIPIYEEICNIMSKNYKLDFTDIHQFYPFNIFLNFIQSSELENFNHSIEIISHVIIRMFIYCGTSFAEEFSSSPLCKIFVENVSMPVLHLFSLLIGESEKINRNLTGLELIARINDLDIIQQTDNQDFRRVIFLIYANYTLKCDITDFMNCQNAVIPCLNEIQNETDNECYYYRMLCISRAMERSDSIMKILVAKKIILYINQILSSDDESKITQCLVLLEILTSNANEISDQLSSELSLPDLLKHLLNFDEIGLKAMHCFVNLMSSNVFSINQYVQINFPQYINNIFVNGPYKMKKSAFDYINNMMYYKYKISSLFPDEVISNIILAIVDFSFDGNSNANDDFISSCLTILKNLLVENKLFHIDEITEFLNNLYHEANNENIVLKCFDILSFIEEKRKIKRNE